MTSPVSNPFPPASTASSTTLPVTWFGGTAETETADPNGDDDSCELVAVRIERTSANSRRILGEIVVDATIDDVWGILTDYDRLAVHVPNLVESRIVQRQTPDRKPGDGSFQCRLFQKGAQKIVGFEFGASVTMDMIERAYTTEKNEITTETRIIQFKCHDSFFFQTFDGEWKAVEQINKGSGGAAVETVLSYVVDVRPKGPVPVAALEWRIREDVPTNLRAVKTAAMLRQRRNQSRKATTTTTTTIANTIPSLKDTQESLNVYDKGNKLRAPKETVALPFQRQTTTAATVTRSGSIHNDNDTTTTSMTPRQRQEQQAAAAARRALRAPRVSAFAQAATPPPRSRRASSSSSSSGSSLPPKNAAPPRRMKVKVDWDDNETLGAYLKQS